MATGYEDVQKLIKDNMETAMKSAGVVSKGFQSMAVEASDYSKKSMEDFTKHSEKLLGAKSLDAVVEIQTEFLKKAYEEAVAQATKFSSLYMDLAKEMAKPYETFGAKFAK